MKNLVLALLLLTVARPSHAAVFKVLNTNDSGSGSLRETIATSPSGSVIEFAPSLSGQTIRLTSGELHLTNSVSITAAGLSGGLVLSGNNSFRILTVTNTSANITLQNLTLVHGNGASSITPSISGQGAAILNQGIMTLIGCTIASNSAGFGAIRQQNGGTMLMTNCTMSANNSTNEGGAYFGAISTTVTMVHCTISSNNAATRGGGIRLGSGTATVTNSIVAGNARGGDLTHFEGNLAATLSGGNNLISTNPLLSVLGNYGGPTPTMPPLPTSPALDTGSNSFVTVLSTDQRGFLRLAGVRPDLGAVEIQRTNPVVATLPATSESNLATLNGAVTPVDFGATAWFEWGSSPFSNTNVTAAVSVGATGYPTNVSSVVSITPGLIYHSRIVASNAWGVTRGNAVSFGSPVVVLTNPTALTNECHTVFTDPFTNPITATGAPLVLAAGGAHNLVIRSDRTLLAWGENFYNQTNIPASLSNVVAVAGGNRHSVALKTDGTVVAWGYNTSLQTNVPAGLSNMVAVAAGDNHSLAIHSNGTVTVWGDGNHPDTITPPVGLTDASAIAAGQWFSLALKSNGTVVGWGYNAYGQLDVPAGLSNVVAISAGVVHGLALKSDGTVVAWGAASPYNFGQTTIPVGLSNVVAIVAKEYNSMALKSDGTVVAWGDNSFDQRNVPAGLSNVVAIAAGRVHSLALKSDGTIVGWGLSAQGLTTAPANMTNLTLTVTRSSTFDTNSSPGTYSLTYTATNGVGGTGSVSRTVVVRDTTPPLLTLLGSNPMTNRFSIPFIDPGATALDACGGSTAVSTNISVNVNVPGTYSVTYTAEDNYGNTVTSNRTVIVPEPTIWTVATTNDSGAGSLRSAVAGAFDGDIVRFTNTLSGAAIVLTSGEITLNKTLTIDASDLPAGIHLNGNASSRIFNVTAGNVLLTALTITNGRSGGLGGGINNSAVLKMDRCSVVGNSCTTGGGGIASIANNGELALYNCTIAGNTAFYGGGIWSKGTNSTLLITHSTISTNIGTNGTGGLVFEQGYCALNNSIIAGNQRIGSSDGDLGGAAGTLNLLGNNIIGARGTAYSGVTPSGAPNANGDYIGTTASPLDALLAPLGNFGGPTQTMPPLPGSPALDHCIADGTTLLIDQRGFNRIVGSFADIGAVEGAFSITVSLTHLMPSNQILLSFQLPFTNSTGVSFSVLANTDIAAPLNTWSNLGSATEVPSGSGQFQFIDSQAANNPGRFYRVKTP